MSTTLFITRTTEILIQDLNHQNENSHSNDTSRVTVSECDTSISITIENQNNFPNSKKNNFLKSKNNNLSQGGPLPTQNVNNIRDVNFTNLNHNHRHDQNNHNNTNAAFDVRIKEDKEENLTSKMGKSTCLSKSENENDNTEPFGSFEETTTNTTNTCRYDSYEVTCDCDQEDLGRPNETVQPSPSSPTIPKFKIQNTLGQELSQLNNQEKIIERKKFRQSIIENSSHSDANARRSSPIRSLPKRVSLNDRSPKLKPKNRSFCRTADSSLTNISHLSVHPKEKEIMDGDNGHSIEHVQNNINVDQHQYLNLHESSNSSIVSASTKPFYKNVLISNKSRVRARTRTNTRSEMENSDTKSEKFKNSFVHIRFMGKDGLNQSKRAVPPLANSHSSPNVIYAPMQKSSSVSWHPSVTNRKIAAISATQRALNNILSLQVDGSDDRNQELRRTSDMAPNTSSNTASNNLIETPVYSQNNQRTIRIFRDYPNQPLGISVAGGVGSSLGHNINPFIAYLSQNGAASKLVYQGEQLISIDGINCQNFSHSKLIEKMKSCEVRVDLVLEKASEQTLELSRYLEDMKTQAIENEGAYRSKYKTIGLGVLNFHIALAYIPSYPQNEQFYHPLPSTSTNPPKASASV